MWTSVSNVFFQCMWCQSKKNTHPSIKYCHLHVHVHVHILENIICASQNSTQSKLNWPLYSTPSSSMGVTQLHSYIGSYRESPAGGWEE